MHTLRICTFTKGNHRENKSSSLRSSSFCVSCLQSKKPDPEVHMTDAKTPSYVVTGLGGGTARKELLIVSLFHTFFKNVCKNTYQPTKEVLSGSKKNKGAHFVRLLWVR